MISVEVLTSLDAYWVEKNNELRDKQKGILQVP